MKRALMPCDPSRPWFRSPGGRRGGLVLAPALVAAARPLPAARYSGEPDIQAGGGRGLAGLIASETNDALVVRGIGGTETLARTAIQSCTPLGAALMPDGLEGALDEQRMAGLIAFLHSNPDSK